MPEQPRNLNIICSLWCGLWDYEEITSSKILQRHICDSIQNLGNLVVLNLAYIANDKIW